MVPKNICLLLLVVLACLPALEGLSCKHGYRAEESWINAESWNDTACAGLDEYCLRAKARVVVFNFFLVNVDAGLCVNTSLCQKSSCNQVAKQLLASDPFISEAVAGTGYNVLNCDVRCCQNDYCNRLALDDRNANYPFVVSGDSENGTTANPSTGSGDHSEDYAIPTTSELDTTAYTSLTNPASWYTTSGSPVFTSSTINLLFVVLLALYGPAIPT